MKLSDQKAQLLPRDETINHGISLAYHLQGVLGFITVLYIYSLCADEILDDSKTELKGNCENVGYCVVYSLQEYKPVNVRVKREKGEKR